MAFTPAVSPTKGVVYESIEKVIAENHPGTKVTPSVMTGFTDSHFTRDAGIDSYGFDPTVVDEVDAVRGAHASPPPGSRRSVRSNGRGRLTRS